MEAKKAYLSWTLWFNLACAVAALVSPSVADFLKAHFAESVSIMAGINMLLRIFKTNTAIQFWN